MAVHLSVVCDLVSEGSKFVKFSWNLIGGFLLQHCRQACFSWNLAEQRSYCAYVHKWILTKNFQISWLILVKLKTKDLLVMPLSWDGNGVSEVLPSFVHFPSYAVWHRRFPQISVEELWVSRKLTEWKSYFTYLYFPCLLSDLGEEFCWVFLTVKMGADKALLFLWAKMTSCFSLHNAIVWRS